MTKPIRIFTILAAVLAAGTSLRAQSAVKVATVDLNRAYSEYWKTQDKMGKLMERSKDAQDQIDEMKKRIEKIAAEGKQLQQDAENPAINAEAKDRIKGDAQRKFQEFQEMQDRLRQFADNMERSLAQDKRVFQELMIDEIKSKVLDIAKGKGANLIIDTSGKTMNGVSSILYADPGFDVTDVVITELNKTKPADFKPPVLPDADESTAPAPAPQP